MSFLAQIPQYFKTVYDYFNKCVFPIPFFDFSNIYYTNDINEDYIFFKEPSTEENYNNTTGLTILPNNIIENTIVLIKYRENDICANICTMIHELVHVYDMNMFANVLLGGKYDGVTSHKFYKCYVQWSEFKAKAYGELHSFLCMDLLSNTNNTEVLMNSFETEIKKFLQKMRQKVINKTFHDIELCDTFYMYDKYKGVNDITQSCVYLYLPELFDLTDLNLMYRLY